MCAPIISGGTMSEVHKLHPLTFQRVIAVAGPHALRAFQHAEVDATAAARTGLDLDAGKRLLQPVKQAVERKRLQVANGTARCGVARLEQIAIVIPLEVRGSHRGDERVQPLLDVRVRLGMREVQHLLRACLNG